MGLPQKLKLLRDEKGLTQRELARLLHIGYSTLGMYEIGEREPDYDMLKKIADFFGVTADYLLDYPEKTNAGIKETNAGYYTPQSVLDELRAKVAAIENNNGLIIPAAPQQIPVLGVIRAGKPIYADEHIEEWIPIDKHTASLGEHFYLRVKGDSMFPTITEGSLVLIRRQDYVEPGQIAVVIVDGEDATLKRVYCDEENCILESDNKSYRPMVFPKEDIIILGRAIKITQDLP